MKTDIRNRSDIEKLVNSFYGRIKTDATIGYLFTDVAKVNWELHLPRMYDFWDNILFSSGNFEGNPMVKHKELHEKSEMNKGHFDRWNFLFNQTVDDLFIGTKAEEIKLRAMNISALMMHKTLG